MENESDMFQLKADFVAFPSGIISILVHVPLAENKLKLYKLIPTPVVNGKYQFLVDCASHYLAINEDSTLYSTLENLNKCTILRDSIICNDINVLHKAGSSDTSDTCLFDLYNNRHSTKAKCEYRIQKQADFAVRLSDKEVFFLTQNNTVLTTKSDGNQE